MSNVINEKKAQQFDELQSLNERHKSRKNRLRSQQERELRELDQTYSKKRRDIEVSGKKALERTRDEAHTDRANFSKESQRLKAKHQNELKKIEKDYETQFNNFNKKAFSSLKNQQEQADNSLTQLRKEEVDRIEQLRTQGQEVYSKEHKTQKTMLGQMRTEYNDKMTALTQTHAEQQNKLIAGHSDEVKDLNTRRKTEVMQQQKMLKTELQKVQAQHEAELSEAEELLQKRLQTKMETYKARIEEQDKNFQNMLKQQKLEFDEAYSKTQANNSASIDHQEKILAQSLIEQKRNFIRRFGDPEATPEKNFKQFSPKLENKPGAFVVDIPLPKSEKEKVNVVVKDNKLVLSRQKDFNDKIQNGERTLTMSSNESFREVIPFSEPVLQDNVIKEETPEGLRLTIPKIKLTGGFS